MSARNTWIVALGLGLAWLLGCGEAKPPPKVWRVGLFHAGQDQVPPSLDGLRHGLRALGYEEGKNIRLDVRNPPDAVAARAAAREFVSDRVDLIVAFEDQTLRAAMAATVEIPIVFLHLSDPVADGFVRSHATPGGNVTGVAGLGHVPAKEMELFKEVAPGLRRVLVLADAGDPTAGWWLAEVRRAGAALKLELVEHEARDAAGIERVFQPLRPGSVDGILVVSPNLPSGLSSLILRLAGERRLPVASHAREWVDQGALFSFGPDFPAVGRDIARYVDKILKGMRPTDLPVEEISRFEFVVNLKVAKALGLNIPQSVIARADQVIQ